MWYNKEKSAALCSNGKFEYDYAIPKDAGKPKDRQVTMWQYKNWRTNKKKHEKQ